MNLASGLAAVLRSQARSQFFADILTSDLTETGISYRRERELEPVALRPHPYDFFLSGDI